MEYGIIVCPSCRFAKTVDLSSRTTKCIRCGKVLKLQNLKILYSSSSLRKVQHMLGVFNAQKDGRAEELKDIL
jgi:uncharacterized protein (UPF0212 family)